MLLPRPLDSHQRHNGPLAIRTATIPSSKDPSVRSTTSSMKSVISFYPSSSVRLTLLTSRKRQAEYAVSARRKPSPKAIIGLIKSPEYRSLNDGALSTGLSVPMAERRGPRLCNPICAQERQLAPFLDHKPTPFCFKALSQPFFFDNFKSQAAPEHPILFPQAVSSLCF